MEYDQVRPAGLYYICWRSSKPLTVKQHRDGFDLALLHTNWALLNMVPHSFRIGGAMHACLQGQGILETRNQGRWAKRSSAIEAYTRQNKAIVPPEKILDRWPQHKKQHDYRCLLYLTKMHITTDWSPQGFHPHIEWLYKLFPEWQSRFQEEVTVPAQEVVRAEDHRTDEYQCGTFLDMYQHKEATLRAQWAKR